MNSSNSVRVNDSKSFGYALVAVFFWSTVATVFKLSLNFSTPEQLVFVSSIFSALFFLLMALFSKSLYEIKNWEAKDWLLVFILSLINPTLYYWILFKAYSFLPAQQAQVINYSWGVLLALMSSLIFKHKLSLRLIAGLALCYSGVALVSQFWMTKSGDRGTQGILLALLSTVLWSSYWLIKKYFKHNPLNALSVSFLISLPLMFALHYPLNLGLMNWRGWFGGLYVGLFEMGITFVLFQKAIRLTSSIPKISALIYLSPILSLILIWKFLDEPITRWTLSGFVLILIGNFLVQKVNEQP
jgi:drug/metabolite transporter (DMT)-like permease